MIRVWACKPCLPTSISHPSFSLSPLPRPLPLLFSSLFPSPLCFSFFDSLSRAGWLVQYKPGTLKVVAYDSSRTIIATHSVTTTGAPSYLKLRYFFNTLPLLFLFLIYTSLFFLSFLSALAYACLVRTLPQQSLQMVKMLLSFASQSTIVLYVLLPSPPLLSAPSFFVLPSSLPSSRE